MSSPSTMLAAGYEGAASVLLAVQDDSQRALPLSAGVSERSPLTWNLEKVVVESKPGLCVFFILFYFILFFHFCKLGLGAEVDHLMAIRLPPSMGTQRSLELFRLVHRRNPFTGTVTCWRCKTKATARPAPDQDRLCGAHASA